MTDLVEQLKLAEKAQEDIYFARINRRLIEALHKQSASSNARKKATNAATGKVEGAGESEQRDRVDS